jgi:hypothetical protein
VRIALFHRSGEVTPANIPGEAFLGVERARAREAVDDAAELEVTIRRVPRSSVATSVLVRAPRAVARMHAEDVLEADELFAVCLEFFWSSFLCLFPGSAGVFSPSFASCGGVVVGVRAENDR